MKKKIFIFTFLLFISFQSKASAYDCDLNKIQTNKSISNFEEEKVFFSYFENPSGASSMVMPIEHFCKGDETNGIILTLFFLENTLVRIIFENALTPNRILFKIANNTYKVGFKKNNIKISRKETETYSINKNENFYFYGNFIGKNEFLEYFEITSNKYKDKLNEELLKREEQ